MWLDENELRLLGIRWGLAANGPVISVIQFIPGFFPPVAQLFETSCLSYARVLAMPLEATKHKSINFLAVWW